MFGIYNELIKNAFKALEDIKEDSVVFVNNKLVDLSESKQTNKNTKSLKESAKKESLKEDTVKQGNAWVNKGKEGTHGKFATKKAADAQRKAMFANKKKGADFGEKTEGYTLFGSEDKNIEAYSNYYNAKARAEELGLKLAEYGDVYGKNISYAYWNKSGDRNDDEEVICYYYFDKNGKPKAEVTESELERIADTYGLPISDIDDADEVIDDELVDFDESVKDNKKLKEAKDKYVIYKVNGVYYGTPKSNYDSRVQDAFKIQEYRDFTSARQIMNYLNKWSKTTDDDFEVIDEGCKTISEGARKNDISFEDFLNQAKVILVDDAKSFDINHKTEKQESLKESSWTFDTFDIDKGDGLRDSVSYRWNKGGTYGVYAAEFKDGVQNNLYYSDTFATKEQAKRAYDKWVRKVKEMNNMNESLWGDYKKFDSEEWEDEDVKFWKTIDWKNVSNGEFEKTDDKITAKVIKHSTDRKPEVKEVEMVKVFRQNPIYPPYYRAVEKPFDDCVGPMYDGHKKGKVDIHDRYETQEVYDILSEDKCESLTEAPIYDLRPEEDKSASFYGKAIVKVDNDGTKTLYSYNVPVVKLKDGKITLGKDWAYSATTLRHVKEFLKQHGFKALNKEQILKDYAVEEIVENKVCESLTEAKEIDINDETEVEQGIKELDDNEEVTREEQIVDVDADTVDKLKDSYIGNVILQCPVCRTLLYKKPDALKVSEDDEKIYNVDEECPHCGSQDGFEIVGQVASMDVAAEEPVDTTGVEDDAEVPEDITIEDKIDDTEEEIKFESLDKSKFDYLVNRFAKRVYENVDSFRTTKYEFNDNANTLVVEGLLKGKNGKEVETHFVFAPNKVSDDGRISFIGMNETFSKSSNAFVLVAKKENNELICEQMSYNFSNKELTESVSKSTYIKGCVIYRA